MTATTNPQLNIQSQVNIYCNSDDINMTQHHMYCYFCDITDYSNSDFDADHDSPKGEVNPNVFVNLSDVSDIINEIVDDKEDSSCLKSLWKSRLCKSLCILTSSKLVCNRRTISCV